MTSFDLREHLRGSLWFIPTLCVMGAVVLALTLVRVDRSGFDADFLFGGGAEGARSFLSTISSSMITFTGLVFSITIVVLQLASQQFSPRVLRTFLRDRHSQFALGVFTATFTYSLVVLREVGSEEVSGGTFVPNLAVTMAFVFVLGSLFLFVDYIHHISQSIRVGNITHSIGEETRGAISDIYDHEHVDEPVPFPSGAPVQTLPALSRGILQGLDRDRMVELARSWDAVVEVIPAMGDFVPEGSPLIRVHGEPSTDVDHLYDAVSLGRERTMRQDPAFGFRQLADIAEKGLSPAVNDPTTAVQCLDEMHDLLRRLATRPFPSGQRMDSDDDLRLVYPVTSWDGYIHLAFDEIRSYGKDSLQIHRRLRSILDDLLGVAPPERHGPMQSQLRLLDASVERSILDDDDRASARRSDEQGLGGT